MAQRPIVLVISGSLSSGGAERFASNLALSIDRTAFDLRLCLVHDEITYALPQDLQVIKLRCRRPLIPFKAAWQLRRILQADPPDIILGTFFYTNMIIFLATLLLKKRPRWIARIAIDERFKLSPKLRISEAFVRKYADVFVANSPGSQREYGRRHPAVGARLMAIANCVDGAHLERLAAAPDVVVPVASSPVIIAVCRLEKQKRPDLLLHAFALLRKRLEVALWICGDGSLRPWLAKQIASAGLTEDARLLGFCANPFPYLRQADIFLLASDFEGMPNALLEAQALGLPAVATRCPSGPADVIEEGVTGLLVPVGDAEAMATALYKILTHEDLKRSMGEAARRLMSARFGPENFAEQWQAAFTDSLKK